MKIPFRSLGMLAVIFLTLGAGKSAAQAYPSKPVRLVVGNG